MAELDFQKIADLFSKYSSPGDLNDLQEGLYDFGDFELTWRDKGKYVGVVFHDNRNIEVVDDWSVKKEPGLTNEQVALKSLVAFLEKRLTYLKNLSDRYRKMAVEARKSSAALKKS